MAKVGQVLPSVTVAGGEAHEAVGKVVLADVGAELASKEGRLAHSTIPVTDDGLGDKSSEVIIVLPADTLDGKGNVGRGDGVITKADFRADELRGTLLLGGQGLGSGGRGLAREAAEVLLGQADKLLVGNATSANQDHAVSGVVGFNVIGQIVTGDGLNVLLGAKDGATKRLALEGGGMKVVKDNLLELLVNLLLLAQDHITLALDGGGLQLGVLKNIGENINRFGDIGVEGFCVVDSVFALWFLLVLFR